MREGRRDRWEWKTRAEWVDELRSLCSRMNAAGAEPQWTGRRLNAYANEKFQVLHGTGVLTFEELRRLRDDLKHKAETLEAAAAAA